MSPTAASTLNTSQTPTPLLESEPIPSLTTSAPGQPHLHFQIPQAEHKPSSTSTADSIHEITHIILFMNELWMEVIPESGTGGGEEWTKVKESMKKREQKQQINTEWRKDARMMMCLILKLKCLGPDFFKATELFFCSTWQIDLMKTTQHHTVL